LERHTEAGQLVTLYTGREVSAGFTPGIPSQSRFYSLVAGRSMPAIADIVV
jgi:hypothetical protein